MNKYIKQLNQDSLVVQVVLNGSRLKAVDPKGNTHQVPGYRRQAAFDNNEALAQIIGSTGRPYWRPVPMDEFNSRANIPAAVEAVEVGGDHQEQEGAEAEGEAREGAGEGAGRGAREEQGAEPAAAAAEREAAGPQSRSPTGTILGLEMAAHARRAGACEQARAPSALRC